jgi:hypothetical protein
MAIQQTQRVSSMRFLLYSRPLHPELFDIYHTGTVRRRNYEAQIWVTGLGHIIGFYAHKEAALTEVMTDQPDRLPQRDRLLFLALRGEKTRRLDLINGTRYFVSLQVERMSARVFARAHADLTAQAHRTGLYISFPQWSTDDLSPFTYLDFETRTRQFHVFTFHAFPEERAIVKSQSIFELF